MHRTLFWLVVSIGITVGVSLLLWRVLQVPAFFGFLFLPLFFGFGRLFGRSAARSTVRRCARCGFQATDPDVRFCPRDGASLE